MKMSASDSSFFRSKPNLFVLLTYLCAYPLFIYAAHNGGASESTSLLKLAMWVPAIITFVFVILRFTSIRQIGFHKIGPLKTLIEAAFVPLFLYGLIGVLLFIFSSVQMADSGLTLKNSVVGFTESAKMHLVLGKQSQNIFYFILNLVLTLLMATAFTAIFTIGEEIGWRGYLQAHLISKFGVLKGLTFLGIIWGFWHFPFILSGYNFPDYPVFGSLLLMQIFTVFSSFWIGYLYIKSKSIYVAAIAHAAGNVSDTVVGGFFKLEGSHYLYDLARFVLLGILALWSYRRICNERLLGNNS